ncbi:Kinesin-like protein kin-14f [Thalictrum thalictroides]|uniref:Kinesin-like protein kin-14f n=1 Tax=Thalictrum thalictroides TaxID=46969 RepID=A0A7J6W4T2_THATH|nr:Kinesin-like protein kin-14f [Thalictrum thalictroides]
MDLLRRHLIVLKTLKKTSEQAEEEFCLALRNGLILCNVLNKIKPGAISKVVESPIQTTDIAAQSAIQYFENMRNFLVSVADMKLLTFEASDLEKGGSSVKVVDCILCLKGYYEWKQAGGIGTWRYGGTVKITALPKDSVYSVTSPNAEDDFFDSFPHDQQLLQYLKLSTQASVEKDKSHNALAFLFDRFGLGLLQSYLTHLNGTVDIPLNAMLIDTLLKKVVKDFKGLLVSHSNQLGLLLKGILNDDGCSISKGELIEAISKYLVQRHYGDSNDLSTFCICGGKREEIHISSNHISEQVERLDLQQNQLEVLKSNFRETRATVKDAQSNWEDELRRLEFHIKSLEVASSSYHKLLEENRLLYNKVQDLKGTIRVFCRVRPFLPGQVDAHSTVDYIGENGNIMIVNPHKHGKDARKVFTFNKVFGANVTQQQVFADTEPLIRSVLDGYNVCIFAYGQTGSGKTYTMNGPDLTTEETWGVNYRALNDLFEISNSRLDFIRYEVSVQMIEIYNEQVRDLLVSDGTNRRYPLPIVTRNTSISHTFTFFILFNFHWSISKSDVVRHFCLTICTLDIWSISQPNGLNVPDASLVPVKCTQDVLDLMLIGQKNRAVGATALNERSSRSHSVLAVHVHGKELVSGSILRGCLHLVDLAGSERVDKSEAVGERLKEAQHINRSLSALGDVISSLAQKNKHIPYRNSKLTQVLQDSLGGQAKTLMFVHINPEVSSFGETISTLKFAERVGSIELGAARSNKETGEIKALKEEISNLKLELGRKEAELEQLRDGNIQIRVDPQKQRAVSPFYLPRLATNANIKPEITQRSISDARSIEVRSCSSGKQRRSRFPSGLTDRDPIPKMPFLSEDDLLAGKPRSPSPPVRRSISTDRGSLRLKHDTHDNQHPGKLHLPTRIAVNKSIASIPEIPTSENNSRIYLGHKYIMKPEICSETLSSLQRVNWRNVHLESEDHHLKQALNVRQGGIRKTKPETKPMLKHQFPTRMQKPEAPQLLNEEEMSRKVEVIQKSDFSETENEHGPVESPVCVSPRVKKQRQNFARNFQNLEHRGVVQAVEPLLAERNDNKLQNGVIHYGKEGRPNSTMPSFRRSRSSPRGKFTILP